MNTFFKPYTFHLLYIPPLRNFASRYIYVYFPISAKRGRQDSTIMAQLNSREAFSRQVLFSNGNLYLIRYMRKLSQFSL